MNKTTVAIIGAGPAGITAAIQLKRYGVDFVIFERDRIGGLLANANLVENFPGFPGGISGKKFCKLLDIHLKQYDINVTYKEVRKTSHNGSKFTINTDSGLYESQYLIAATGTKPVTLDVEITGDIIDRVLYEIKDLPESGVNSAIIIGGGDAAFDYALNLADKGINVTILIRKNQPSALPLLINRVNNNPNISVIYNSEVTRIEKDNNDLLVYYNRHKSIKQLKTDYVLCAIGRHPNFDFIPDVVTSDFNIERINNLYFCGDMKNGLFRQAAIAAGDGLKAAMEIYYKIKQRTNCEITGKN